MVFGVSASNGVKGSDPGSARTARIAASLQEKDGVVSYEVKKGDTLSHVISALKAKYPELKGLNIRQLARDNGISNIHRIEVGTKIEVVVLANLDPCKPLPVRGLGKAEVLAATAPAAAKVQAQLISGPAPKDPKTARIKALLAEMTLADLGIEIPTGNPSPSLFRGVSPAAENHEDPFGPLTGPRQRSPLLDDPLTPADNGKIPGLGKQASGIGNITFSPRPQKAELIKPSPGQNIAKK